MAEHFHDDHPVIIGLANTFPKLTGKIDTGGEKKSLSGRLDGRHLSSFPPLLSPSSSQSTVKYQQLGREILRQRREGPGLSILELAFTEIDGFPAPYPG